MTTAVDSTNGPAAPAHRGLRRLATRSLIYTIGGIVLRGAGFLLLPVYTRLLTRGDYGIVAVAGVVTQILTIVFSLGLQNAAVRLHVSLPDEDARRRAMGTLWIVMASISIAGALALDIIGTRTGHLGFQSIPFHPFIRLAIWAACFNGLSQLPPFIYQAQERPQAYVSLALFSQLFTYACIVGMLVLQLDGARSYLTGHLIAMGLLAPLYLWITFRYARLSFDSDIARIALRFGLPLVPHALATWVLDFSDRLVLDRYVSLEELGLYSLAYTFGSLMALTAVSLNNAWLPAFYRMLDQPVAGLRDRLPSLLTYYVLALSFAAAVQIAIVGELIRIFTAPAFHAAARLAPWIILGQLLAGLYNVPSNYLLHARRTWVLPLVTAAAGVVNVTLNLLLVPQYGTAAAAWTTAGCYGLMLLLGWWASERFERAPYEYGRIARIALAVAVTAGLAALVPPLPLVAAALAKLGVVLAFPVTLWLTGFFSDEERRLALAYSRRWRGAVR